MEAENINASTKVGANYILRHFTQYQYLWYLFDVIYFFVLPICLYYVLTSHIESD